MNAIRLESNHQMRLAKFAFFEFAQGQIPSWALAMTA